MQVDSTHRCRRVAVIVHKRSLCSYILWRLIMQHYVREQASVANNAGQESIEPVRLGADKPGLRFV